MTTSWTITYTLIFHTEHKKWDFNFTVGVINQCNIHIKHACSFPADDFFHINRFYSFHSFHLTTCKLKLYFNKWCLLLSKAKLFLFVVCDVCEWQYIIKNKIKPCMGDTFSICHSLIACLRATNRKMMKKRLIESAECVIRVNTVPLIDEVIEHS